MFSPVFLLGVLFAGIPQSHATKYIELKLPDMVKRANLIAVATITEQECLDSKGVPVPEGKRCSAPGIPNHMRHKITIKEVLFYAPSIFRDKSSRPPKEVVFENSSAAYTRVPEGRYASSIGKEYIYFLREGRDGKLTPIHEVFFSKPLTEKDKIKSQIQTQIKGGRKTSDRATDRAINRATTPVPPPARATRSGTRGVLAAN